MKVHYRFLVLLVILILMISSQNFASSVASLEEGYLAMVRQHRTTISRSEDYTNNWYAAQDIEDIVKHMPPSEIAHILDECSDVSGEISKTCIDAMDAIFLQLPANTHIWSNAYFDQLRLVDRPTYADIFQSPEKDLQDVKSALESEECLVHESDEIRPELQQQCHAEAFTRVHFVQLNCEIFEGIYEAFPVLFDTDSENTNRLFQTTFNKPATDQAPEKELQASQDAPARDKLWDINLQTRWVLNRCNRLDRSNIELLSQEYRGDMFVRRHKLLEIAARLGEKQALLHTLLAINSKIPAVSEYIETKFRWLDDYDELARDYSPLVPKDRTDLFDFAFDTFQSQLIQYIKTMHQAKQLGWSYDLPAFVTDFCSPFYLRLNWGIRELTWPGDCSWLVYGIREGKKLTGASLLDLLDEFEQTAISLNVYQIEETPAAETVFGFHDLEGDHDYERVVSLIPVYPEKALRDQIEGFAEVRFGVSETGAVIDASVVNSEPGETFNHAALDALLMSRYRPRIQNGQPVRTDGILNRVRFVLQEAE
ncbi:MAG: energy transducer TonB [Gammaproteobacteria bacterium]|nr:energy transducer TonB [Gammaproteobacteria bacterium]